MRRCTVTVVTSRDPPGVDVKLDVDDLKYWVTLTGADPQRPDSRQLYWMLRGALWVVLVIASILHPIVWIAVVIEAVIVFIERRARARAQPARAIDRLNGRFEVSPRGLHRRSSIGETLISWTAVERVSQTGTHVLVRFLGTGYVLPFRCFHSDEHRQQFVAAMSLYVDGRRADTTEQIVDGS